MDGQKSTRALQVTPEEFEERMRGMMDVIYHSDTESVVSPVSHLGEFRTESCSVVLKDNN